MTATDVRTAQEVAPLWRHIPALDGLRAWAVIAVLLFHGGYLQGGFLGVDLFFVLSGYLITSLLIRDAEGSGIGLTAFWGRRFRRLLPAAFAMIAVVAVWSWSFGSGADLDGVKRDGPWAVLYVANWHFIGESSGYWASFAQPSMFDHLWSLAIEEQFYVLWPIAILVIWRLSSRPQRALVIATALGAIASLLLMLSLYGGGDPTRVYMGTDTRASALLVGALAASAPVREWTQRLVAALGRRLDVVIAVLAALIALAWITIDGASAEALYRGGLFAHSIACAAIIGLVGAARGGRAPSVFGWRPLVWIGTLSYGLYLWHWPIYVVVSPSSVGFDGVGLLSVRVGLSFAAAIISFHLVENPLRFRATWVRGVAGAVVLGVSVVGLLFLLRVLPEPDVEIATFDPASVAVGVVTERGDGAPPVVATTTPPRPATGSGSEPDGRPADLPTPPPPSSAPSTTSAPVPLEPIGSVLWAGDSVAYDLAPALGEALTNAGVPTALDGAYYGLTMNGSIESRRLRSHLPPRLAARPADTVIATISTWDGAVPSQDYRAAVLDLMAAIEENGGNRLVMVSSPPLEDANRNADLDRLADVVGDLAATDHRITFLDASPVWERPAVLDRNGDGAPERKRDLIHVCPAGAAQFATWLTVQLDARFVGLEPVDPTVWAGGPWTTDLRYDEPVGACAPV